MRHLLISYAQRQASQKRGNGAADLPLDEALLIPQQRSEELLALDEALERLKEADPRSEEHTSELQSLMRISYAVFCLKKKKKNATKTSTTPIARNTIIKDAHRH